ncbi:MAG: PD40 domain-containing protein [Bryobacteraceae bacterium]|nr:PD40 domain-containing protein [Bryobacteraceae bacterium]
MPKPFLAIALLLLPLAGQENRRPPLAEPAISPDRSEVAFASGGDLWTVPAGGGVARLLVSHPAFESRPIYSPDGKQLGFTSTRTGNGDVYTLNLATGDLKRLTFHESPERMDGWSPDGRYVYFSSNSADISGMQDVFRVSAEGGTPMVYSGDRYASEYFAAPSPTSPDVVAITAKGVVSGQWWRNGHSHIDESEIWIRQDGAPPKYIRLSSGGSKDAWPMWSADGKKLFYMSDKSGAENIWTRPVSGGGPGQQLTKFSEGRVLWPSISGDGKQIVFERAFAVWTLDPATGKTAEIPITLRGAPAAPGTQRVQLTSGFRDLALSPDGKKVAFTARGDVFAASSKDGGTATRLTSTPGLESSPTWAPDNRRVVYTSDREGAVRLYLYDLGTNKETQLTSGSETDTSPVWSPDGKSLAFLRSASRLVILDLASKAEREVAKTYNRMPPLEPGRAATWSPDGQWLAYGDAGTRLFRNVAIVPVSGGKPITASFLANTFGGSIAWSPDGKYILFDSGQRTENSRVARIDLIPRTPRFREDQFRELFKDEPNKTPTPAQPAATGKSDPVPEAATKRDDPKRTTIVAEGIRNRLTVLPIGVDATSLAISPDGKLLLMSGQAAGQTNLWTFSLDELSREPAVARQLTSTPGRKADFAFTPDSKEVYFLENGRIQSINVDNRQARSISVTAETDLDFATDKREVFSQAWTYLNSHFYDEAFHGADWKAIRTRLEPYVGGSKTPEELRRVLSLMIGELNASHTGISGPPPGPQATGNLGLRFDRAVYESSGKFRVTEVIRLSPADVGNVKPGEYVVAVEGIPVGARTNLTELLEFKSGRRVNLTIATDAAGANPREVAVSPVSGIQEKALLYRQWVESSREYVHKASNGRLGYVHMADMSAGSLDQLYLDLDTENVGREGVVVDVRNNNGGFVNAYALDVLSRRPFLQMTPRGAPTIPARSFLGQRSLERPTVLVVNQHSLSDAEDFAEGYRAMGLGKIVGEPTAGWIIYTSNTELIDGSVLRLPGIRITDMNGKNMERNPRAVDVPVLRAIGESYFGQDTQLDAAVRELLKTIGAAPKTSSNPAPRPAGTL